MFVHGQHVEAGGGGNGCMANIAQPVKHIAVVVVAAATRDVITLHGLLHSLPFNELSARVLFLLFASHSAYGFSQEAAEDSLFSLRKVI